MSIAGWMSKDVQPAFLRLMNFKKGTIYKLI